MPKLTMWPRRLSDRSTSSGLNFHRPFHDVQADEAQSTLGSSAAIAEVRVYVGWLESAI